MISTPQPSTTTEEPLRGNAKRRILTTAAEVFAANGYARTTTRSLATAAGISEVTLFRHFGSKENLFAAVVDTFGGSTLAGELEAELTGSVQADLQQLGRRFIRIALERSRILRLMFFEADHFPEVAQALAQNPRQFREMLARYLDRQVAAGRLRALNTKAAAQAFWGMILAYSLVVDALKENVPGGQTPEEVVAHFVDIFIHGITLTDDAPGKE